MCVPLAVIGLAATVAGAAVGAAGAISASNSQAAALNYQAQVAANNQKVANYEAENATEAGNVSVENQQLQTARVIGGERAAAGANGIDPNSGSALGLQASSAIVGQQDALTIRANSARTAYGYTVAGLSDQAQGALDTSAASNASTAGVYGAFGSILSGASTVGPKWNAYLNAGGSTGAPAGLGLGGAQTGGNS